MIKFCMLLLSLSLFARENPFFPVGSALDIPLATTQIKKAPMLQQSAFTLPSSAREIERIIVQYKNMDGSIAEKNITLQKSIDWHLPIHISQYSTPTTTANRRLKYKNFLSLPFISFYIKEKNMQIITKDRLLHSFLLVKPHRIVCDFKRDVNLKSFIKKIKYADGFKEIKIGTHSGYYRVVIVLDGFYKYRINKRDKGYFISLY